MISRLFTRGFVVILAFTLLAANLLSGQVAPQLLPYQTSRVAGGGTATYTAGQTCPSGKIATDAYGDGCLATEVQLNAPRYVTEDSLGNIYFSDYSNKLIRKIDTSGVISTVAGGGTLAPGLATKGAACPSGSGTSADFQGDGCLATDLLLSKPAGVAISPLTGDLVFSDVGTYTVRGVSKQTGVVYNIAGNVSGTAATYGYVVNSATQNIDAATGSTIDAPYGLHFDATGNLYIAEEYKNAILVVNTSADTTTVAGISIAPGTIAKIVGTRGGLAYCPNGPPASPNGCAYGSWTSGNSASTSLIDNPYDVTADALGNVYFANEYNAAIGQITSSGTLYTYAGKQASGLVTNVRGPASTVNFGSPFGMAADQAGNIYIADSVTGWIWRVDADPQAAAGTQAMYVFAGAGPVCDAALDANGDGCPSNQTVFPASTQLMPSATAPTYAKSPGLSGLFVDQKGALLIANTVGNTIHKMTVNADFGTIQPTNPVQTILVHFGAGDGQGSYTLTNNFSNNAAIDSPNFTIGTSTCTPNSDTTVDCTVPITAAPQVAVAGPFSSTLHIVSASGKTNDYTLSGTLTLDQVESNTTISLSKNSTNPVTPITITATIGSSVSTTYSGPLTTITFFRNGEQIGDPQPVVGNTASIESAFPVGTYQITATYNGNLFLFPSTSAAQTLTSVDPVFTFTPILTSMVVAQGQTALTSFNITTQGMYTGTVTFACSGLPTNAACVFSPTSLTVGTDSYNTVALSIVTTAATQASISHPADPARRRTLPLYCFAPFAFGVVLLGRKKSVALSSILLIAVVLTGMLLATGCSSGNSATQAALAPAGSYTVTVTATGTPNVVSTATNVVQTQTLTLTVNSR